MGFVGNVTKCLSRSSFPIKNPTGLGRDWDGIGTGLGRDGDGIGKGPPIIAMVLRRDAAGLSGIVVTLAHASPGLCPGPRAAGPAAAEAAQRQAQGLARGHEQEHLLQRTSHGPSAITAGNCFFNEAAPAR